MKSQKLLLSCFLTALFTGAVAVNTRPILMINIYGEIKKLKWPIPRPPSNSPLLELNNQDYNQVMQKNIYYPLPVSSNNSYLDIYSFNLVFLLQNGLFSRNKMNRRYWHRPLGRPGPQQKLFVLFALPQYASKRCKDIVKDIINNVRKTFALINILLLIFNLNHRRMKRPKINLWSLGGGKQVQEERDHKGGPLM